jgi:hypothetical protein
MAQKIFNRRCQGRNGETPGPEKGGRILDIKPDGKMTFNELTKWHLKLETFFKNIDQTLTKTQKRHLQANYETL